MRIRWDGKKRRLVLRKRKIDFAHLEDLLCVPYIEDQRSDNPDQYRIIGFAGGQVTTFIVEYREDDLGELIWLITAWKSTKQEKAVYEKEISKDRRH